MGDYFSLFEALGKKKVAWIEDQIKVGNRNIAVKEFIQNNRLEYKIPTLSELVASLKNNSKRVFTLHDLKGFSELAIRGLRSEHRLNLLLEKQREAYRNPIYLSDLLGITGAIFFQEGRVAPEINLIVIIEHNNNQEALYGYIDKNYNLIFQNPEFSLDDRSVCSEPIAALIQATILSMLHDRLVRVGVEEKNNFEHKKQDRLFKGRRPRGAHIVKMGDNRCRTPEAFYNALVAFDLGLLTEDQWNLILESDHNTFNKGDDVDLPTMLDERDNVTLAGWIKKKGGLVVVLNKFLSSFSLDI